MPLRSAMTRMVVPLTSPVSVNARRAALRMDALRASAVSRRARGPLATFFVERVAGLAIKPPQCCARPQPYGASNERKWLVTSRPGRRATYAERVLAHVGC